VHGLVVSTILILAAFSSLFGGQLANKVGRLREVEISAVAFESGAAREASSVRLGMLDAAGKWKRWCPICKSFPRFTFFFTRRINVNGDSMGPSYSHPQA
jgi:hypothetical protein